jgi:hypothetical protein
MFAVDGTQMLGCVGVLVCTTATCCTWLSDPACTYAVCDCQLAYMHFKTIC